MGPVNMPIRLRRMPYGHPRFYEQRAQPRIYSEVPCVLSVSGSSLSEAELMQ